MAGNEPAGGSATSEFPRILGRFSGTPAGPTMLVLGGIHGNEPSGVHASRRLLDGLDRVRPSFRGELIALTGNRKALARGCRFIEKDLNRRWTEERVALLEGSAPGGAEASEDREQREILEVLEEAIGNARGEIYFLDLHTSSAEGPPFVTIGDTLRQRKFALRLPLPVILGLEEQIDGALLEYMNNRGHITLGVEAGGHDRPGSVDNHEAVLWFALAAAGLLREQEIPDRPRHRRILFEAARDIPRIIEVTHRRRAVPGREFRMEPGFVNFHPVKKGQLLARDRQGDVYAGEDGLILLPLYQGQGDDGFFLCRRIKGFWLRLSTVLRRLRLGSLAHLLPGVRRHPVLPETLVIDTRVARWYPLDMFHLLGFRKRRMVGTTLTVTRRRFDHYPPASQ